jgi:DNA-binding FrmR family transcriptional regulator
MQEFPEIGKRLKRASGHLAGILEMLEEGRSCLDIAQQLHAVEKAIGNAKKELIKDHLHHCLEEGGIKQSRETRKLLVEFQNISKYL